MKRDAPVPEIRYVTIVNDTIDNDINVDAIAEAVVVITLLCSRSLLHIGVVAAVWDLSNPPLKTQLVPVSTKGRELRTQWSALSPCSSLQSSSARSCWPARCSFCQRVYSELRKEYSARSLPVPTFSPHQPEVVGLSAVPL